MAEIRPQTVNAARAIMTWALRAIALALVALGLYLVLKKVGFGIGTSQPRMIYDVFTDTGEGHALYRGIAMILVGVPIGLLSRRLAAWMIVVPSNACPACGHDTERTDDGRCTECGLPAVGRSGGA